MATKPNVFVKEVVDELKKSNGRQDPIIRLTITVLIISALVGVFLGGIDMVLTRLLEAFVSLGEDKIRFGI